MVVTYMYSNKVSKEKNSDDKQSTGVCFFFFLPTSSVEEAEKALSGSLKFQPIPRGLEQGAA